MRAPDIEGPFGQAWRMRYPGDQKASCGEWLVHGPWHPLWSYWLVSAVHLRGIMDGKPAHLQFPGATHEYLIFSLESPPCNPIVPDAELFEQGKQRLKLLSPQDLCHQVILLSDEQATRIVEQVVRMAVQQGASLDSDHAERWREMLNNTAEHARLGGHPDR